MSYEKYIAHPAARDEAIWVLQGMLSRLKQYEQKPNANPEFVAKQKEALQALYHYIELTDYILYHAEQDRKDAYAEGRRHGRAENNTAPTRHHDPEAQRGYSLLRAATDFPDLF